MVKYVYKLQPIIFYLGQVVYYGAAQGVISYFKSLGNNIKYHYL